MSKPVIGIFPGSFNPVHIGHLALANYLCEFECLDEVWFLVTLKNPGKTALFAFSGEQRLAWIRAAIRNYPKFKASDFEWHLPEPYYTLNTLQALRESYPDKEFVLIVGADNWAVFNRWKDSAVILEQFRLLVYPRKGFECIPDERFPQVCFSQAPIIEISSSFIRENIEKGKDLRFFVPEEVADFLS